MGKRIALAILLLCLGSTAIIAQAAKPPDLSGTWVRNPTKSQVPREVTNGPDTIVIRCSGSRVRMQHTTVGQERTETFITDGKEHLVRKVPANNFLDQIVGEAFWEKKVLVVGITLKLKTRPPGAPVPSSTHFTQRWTLSVDGRTLTEEDITDRYRSLSVFDKQ